MCGIIGICSPEAVGDRAWLGRGRDAMRHRGPDDAGEWWSEDGRIGLGHRRLAILDLTSAGHQPMRDEQSGNVIVFNGEIYNFQDLRQELQSKGFVFRSRSDTEVVLAAYAEWGTKCLARLQGMFAFAIFDQARQKMFLARDRAGEKPLFYAMVHGALRFASELKGLLADPAMPRRIDPEALDCYLGMGFVPGERCILQGVRKLPPAHALEFDPATGCLRTWRYWHLPDPPEAAADEAGLLDELESLLRRAVRRQLVADVPVGVLLSGGVDSSLITAAAAEATGRLHTFTVRFPGYGSLDETEHARLIARRFATEHTELDAGEITPDMLPQLAHLYDEPIVDSSMVPTYLVSRLVRQHCTVALGGDGGDELFGGYQHYDRLLHMRAAFGWIPLPLRRLVSLAAEAMLPLGFKGRNWLQALGADLHNDLPLIASYFDRRHRRRLLGQNWSCVAEEVRAQSIPRYGDLIERATRADFHNYLAEDILVKVDRASMGNSLEVRAPLLDACILDFAFAKVPSSLKVAAGQRKILLKGLAKRMLPAEFDLQRKQGFSIPLARWLQAGPWRDFFQDVLQDSHEGEFNRGYVQALFRGLDQGRANSERLFALVMFELWRREYLISI